MRKIARELVLTVGAALGLLCIGFAIAVHAFGIAPLVVRSGSMAPTMPIGSLALATPVHGTDVRPGDIVSISRPDGSRITHRVISTAAASQVAVTAYLKGDANQYPDPAPYVIGDAHRVVVTIPLAGYAASWMQTPAARILLGVASITLVYLTFRRRRGPATDDPGSAGHTPGAGRTSEDRVPEPRRRATRHRARHTTATAGVASAVVVALATQQVGAAHAASLVDVAVMSSSISMGTFGNSIPNVRGAVAIATTSGAAGCKISWTAPSSGFSVRVSFLPKGVAVPADHDPTPTTSQSEYTLTAGTLSYVATAPTDVVGTDTTAANGQIFTIRTVRTSDQMVSANFAYGYVYRASSSSNYACGVRSADGNANYTWPATSSGVQSLALKAGVAASTSGTTSSSAASSTPSGAASSSAAAQSSSSTVAKSSGSETSSTMSAAGSSTPPSSSSTSTSSPSTTTVTSTAVAVSGTTSPSKAVSASLTGTTLTLTDTASGATVFTDAVQSGSTLTWDATDDVLTVHQPDGSSVLVKKVGSVWQSYDVTTTTVAPASTTTATPSSQPGTTSSTGAAATTVPPSG